MTLKLILLDQSFLDFILGRHKRKKGDCEYCGEFDKCYLNHSEKILDVFHLICQKCLKALKIENKRSLENMQKVEDERLIEFQKSWKIERNKLLETTDHNALIK